jgi:FHA domain-containing protein/GAF domain-containing protein
MYRLICQDGDHSQTHTFSSGEVTIGRSPDCQVVLKDFGISRTHAKIVVTEDGLRIVDLDSKNGTQVNGVPVMVAPLKDGDRILLGRLQLTLSKTVESTVVVDETRPLPEEVSAAVRNVRELSRRSAFAEVGTATAVAQRRAVEEPASERANRVLNALADFSQKMMTADVDEVVLGVMDIAFEHIAAERGFVMLHDEGGKLVPVVVKNRPSSDEPGQVTISKAIADRVLAERAGILTQDARIDPRLGIVAALVRQDVQSVMCVPLYSRDQVMGILYVESNLRTNEFTPGDLDLLTVLGTYAALAIERARLNDKKMLA